MDDLKIITIDAVDVPDAWFQCISSVLDNGFKYEIQHGSYIGQTRMEFDHITVYIKKPYSEPYDSMLPQIPAHLNIPNPVADGYVEQYMPYLMTDHIAPTEQYTYGSRICCPDTEYPEYGTSQIDWWINILKETPNTNQAVIQVAQPSDYTMPDPPCLRHIDMRIKESCDVEKLNNIMFFRSFGQYGTKSNRSIQTYKDIIKEMRLNESDFISKQLIFYPYFRSWDLWGGFPANLAGIAVLQKHMADEIGVESGPIVASSKGLHLYGYVEELAMLRANKS